MSNTLTRVHITLPTRMLETIDAQAAHNCVSRAAMIRLIINRATTPRK